MALHTRELAGLWAPVLLLAGRGDGEGIRQAEGLAGRLAVRPQLRLTGRRPEEELAVWAAGWFLRRLMRERIGRPAIVPGRRRLPLRRMGELARVGMAAVSVVVHSTPVVFYATPPDRLPKTVSPVHRSPAFFSPFLLENVGTYAAPVFADPDGDGNLDAFVGEFFGLTIYFPNTGSAASPAFAASSANPFGLADVGYSAAPAFADLDGDGDLDAFVGNRDGNTIFFHNTGSAVSPAFAASSANPFGLADVGYSAAPAFADIDGDGDLDAFVGERDGNTVFFLNTGTAVAPLFPASSANPFGMSDPGERAVPAFADLDGDGDLDALVGENLGDIVFFLNTGNAISPAFAASSLNPFGLPNVGAAAAPAFADLDSDGDLDALVGNSAGDTVFFENTGSAVNPAFAASSANPFGLTNVGSHAAPAFADLDGDGDLDAFVSNLPGDTVFFPNTGSSVSPAFAASSLNPFGLVTVGAYASPAFADLGGDGDLDAFVGNGDGQTVFFPNTGNAVSPAFGPSSANPFGLATVPNFAKPAFADLDSDGDLDAFIGEGPVQYFANTSAPTALVLTSLQARAAGGYVEVHWRTANETQILGFHVYRALSPEGPRQQLRGDMIPARSPGAVTGSAYLYRDENPAGQGWYWLEVITLSGTRHLQRLGPVLEGN